jgi:hypothetical protein
MADSTTFTTSVTTEVAIVQTSLYISLTTYTTTNPSVPWITVTTTDENGSSYTLIYDEASTGLTTENLSSVSLSTQTYYGVRPTTSISRITTTVTSQPLAIKSAKRYQCCKYAGASFKRSFDRRKSRNRRRRYIRHSILGCDHCLRYSQDTAGAENQDTRNATKPRSIS